MIIVNYNTADLLSACIRSIQNQSEEQVEVITVDNASQDHSLNLLQNTFPDVKLIANKSNLGFARANNQAVKVSTGDYLYFLNPDTEIRSGAFRTMMEFMDSHPEVGLAGTRIIYPDGSLQSSFERRYPGQRHAKRELRGLKGEIAWVLGASMVTRRRLFEAVEGFDEDFFLYGDDLDLCLRIRKRGWTIGYIPDAVVVHWGGGSERGTVPIEVWKKKLDAESVFYRKHYSKRAIRAIRTENLMQAWWRILTLSISVPFMKNKEESYEKLEKYKLVFGTFRQKGVEQHTTDDITG